jgi:hypothetical protein
MGRVALLVLLLVSVGCASIRPLQSGTETLAPNEGILVVHIRSEVPIQKLAISGITAFVDLPPGDHFRLLAVTEGSHRWSQIVIPADEGRVPFTTKPGDDFWEFRVERGRINYPGDLHFHGKAAKKHAEIGVRGRNRSAQVLQHLRERYPALVERYPPIWAGRGDDDFLDFYGRSFLGQGGAAPEAPR